MPPSADSVQLAMTLVADPMVKYGFAAYQVESDKDEEASYTSIDWREFSYPDGEDSTVYSTVPAYKMTSDSPFILDSGASCHVSPQKSDFKTLTATPPHPISGFGGSCVYAVGVGTVEMQTVAGKQILLKRVLFVPNATVRLISVFSVNNDGNNTCHFDATSCNISDRNGNVLLTGSAWKQRRLYMVDCKAINSFTQPSQDDEHTALYATRTPDLETWHRRLGHCNHRTIIDMARDNVVEGMPIDLSSTPASCDHCILGKQTRSPVPRLREGRKATKRLERVFVDLCGPMPVVSTYGHLYSMNIIDDFSSYVWSLPLARKSNAVDVLRAWHRAVETQTSEKLKVIVTDNGELVSSIMTAWCKLHGIEHQLTAPYTSAQNGRAERLHHTILGKARAMRLSCNAPAEFWDEFCATSAYLTNFTASTSIGGKTPYELWFGEKPSLSHLREIGCRAFALIHTNNPKLFQRSTPCILIGYAPRAKAYRLWNTTTGKVFNSYHVTFIEHLQSQPADLLPGTIINLNPDAPPTWASPPTLTAPEMPTIRTTTHDPVLPSFPPHVPKHPPPVPAPPVLPPPPPIPVQSAPPPPPPPPVNAPAPPAPAPVNAPAPPPPPPVNAPAPPPQTALPPPPSTIQNDNNTAQNNNEKTNTIPNNNNDSNTIRTIASNTNETAPTLCRSARLLAQRPNKQNDLHTAFLSEYTPFFDSHDLVHLDFDPSDFESIHAFLSSISSGSSEPEFDNNDDPSWPAAMRSPEREYWIAGARDELRSLAELKVFALIPRSKIPRGRRPLQGKLVCKRKRDNAGNVVRYKVRYVAKGYTQRYGVDYDKTMAPTARLESFRILMHLAASLDWDIQHIDIKTAFLHGVLPEDETAYLEQPKGFEENGKEDWVMELKKSIYGMKQAGRIWNQTFHDSVTEWGFEQMAKDPCVYRRKTTTGTVIFGVHVDDIYSIAHPPEENKRFKAELRTKWEISDLGPVKYALRIAIERDRESRSIHLSQTAFIDRLVTRFNLAEANPVDSPMVQGLQIRRPDKTVPPDPELVDWISKTPYRELVGSLNYIAVASRPDISFAVGRLASVLDCYRPEHWAAGLRVLRYLKGTRSLRLTLGGPVTTDLSGFADSDYANCQDTSRSVGGYCFSLGSGMVSWRSKKQTHAGDSSCYAEYIALHGASQEAIFLRELLQGLEFLKSDSDGCRPTKIYCDNEAATRLTQDSMWHSNTKHFRVKYHSIRDNVREGILQVIRIPSADNLSDILTKATDRATFLRLRSHLGLRAPDPNWEQR